MNPKEAAGRHAAALVDNDMVVGLGTGSTAFFAIAALGERVAAGLRLRAIPTSQASAAQAEALGIPLIGFEACPQIDVTIDGADEIDPSLDLIKGLGGALLREKAVAAATRRQVIIADPSKEVQRLGTRAPLPVEVVPFAAPFVERRLAALGCVPALRLAQDQTPYLTDNGNHILDCRFSDGIDDAAALERDIAAIPGAVESGLFIGMVHTVIIGEADGQIRQSTA
jgi:ribose 5-phosphate isomerase A